jgi:phosphinothricin acetyltransferase
LIRDVTADDAEAIAAIYNHYILNTSVSFEEDAVSVDEMKNRIAATTKNFPWFVCVDEQSGDITGYAYLHYYAARRAYRNSLENSIYVKKGFERQGIGARLLQCLIDAARKAAVHTIVAIIALPNAGSLGLHEKFGFTQSGVLNEAGLKFGKWTSVCFMQLMLGG